MLVPGRGGGAGSRDWLGSCGKTQLTAFFAESLWRSREVDLLVWVAATSRASVLAGYAEAAEAALGTDPSADAEAIAGRLVKLAGRDPAGGWLVVLDDLAARPTWTGLWPAGPAGQVLITATSPAVLPDGHRALVLPVGAFSSREALSYLMGRLTADPDQRLGAIDLVEDLGCEPMALAQASGVIATSSLSCRDYQGYFTARRDQLADDRGQQTPRRRGQLAVLRRAGRPPGPGRGGPAGAGAGRPAGRPRNARHRIQRPAAGAVRRLRRCYLGRRPRAGLGRPAHPGADGAAGPGPVRVHRRRSG